MTYFIGAYKRKKTLVIQMTTNKDCLSCELIAYFGERENSKANMNRNKNILLSELKKEMPHKYGDFNKIVVE